MNKPALQTSRKKTDQHFNKNDWSSAYKNVEAELNQVKLKVKSGEVPLELSGTLYRNGPGILERNGQWVHHPFDGDGMIASIKFDKGLVTFTNKFIRTDAWKEEEKAGKFIYRGVFGTKKSGGLLANIFDLRLKNIANTNVVRLGDELLALWEAANPYSLNPNNLETYGVTTLNGILKRDEAFSAHPRFDPGHHDKPRMVTFGVKTGPKSTIRLMEFESEGIKAGELISDKKEDFNGFAFLHDFAITPNWAIFLQNSIEFKPLPFILGQKGAAQCLASKPEGRGRFWLIPRSSGCYAKQSPKIFEAPDGFVFHHLNASEENEEVVVIDSIYYDSFPSIKPNEDFREIDFDQLPEGKLKRCQINLINNQVSTKTLSEQCCEFAMVNPHYQGKSTRYSWMATAEQKTGNGPLQAIKKLDLFNGESSSWTAGPRGFVSEPIMIPRHSSKEQDDGWVLTLVWNGATQLSELVILSAKDLQEVAILVLPVAIPHGLHGSWVNSHPLK